MSKKNDTSNVSVGQGVQGGYAFSAPISATVPTDYSTELSEDFVNLGFITEDGIEFGYDGDAQDYSDLNGDVIESAEGKQSEDIVLTLAEVMKDSLSEVFGHTNVDEQEQMITVKHNTLPHEERIYVFELLLKNGRKWRCVVPRGKASRSGSVTVNKTNLVGYQVTIKCTPDNDGNRMYDYIESNGAQPVALSSMTKEQLVVEAQSRGVQVSDKNTKAEIIQILSNGGIQ